jgi:hypothetical protein
MLRRNSSGSHLGNAVWEILSKKGLAPNSHDIKLVFVSFRLILAFSFLSPLFPFPTFISPSSSGRNEKLSHSHAAPVRNPSPFESVLANLFSYYQRVFLFNLPLRLSSAAFHVFKQAQASHYHTVSVCLSLLSSLALHPCTLSSSTPFVRPKIRQDTHKTGP